MSYYVRNYERNGVEIYFDRKPSVAIRDLLKNDGWRWSGYSKCWYNYYSDQHMEFARRICGEKQTNVVSATESIVKDKAITNGKFISRNNEEERISIEIIKPIAKSKPIVSSNPRVISKPIVSLITDSSNESGAKKQKNVIASTLKSERLPFKENDQCIVLFENDEKRIGVVKNIRLDNKQVKVRYISQIRGQEEKYAEKWFHFSDIKKYSRSISISELKEDCIVKFVSKNGILQKGKITHRNYDNTYNIDHYYVDEAGRIIEENDLCVKRDRIIDVFKYDTDIYPIKEGDKVEYERRPNERIIGRVKEISKYGSVSLDYTYTDPWGDKVKQTINYIPMKELYLMPKGRKALKRTLFISAEKQKSIDINEQIKERIKNRSDHFIDAKGIFQNNVLYRHQKAGTILADLYNKFAFFYDTGTGKTVMALDIIAKKQIEDDARFLIIAPKSIIKTAWIDDANKYYPRLRILPLYNGFGSKKKRALLYSWRSGSRASSWEGDPAFYSHIKLIADAFGIGNLQVDDDMVVDEALKASAHHYIINSELFIRDPKKYINELGITGIVMDESAILKNYYGKTAEVMREISSKMKYVYLLSGKPAPNNVIEYFSQMKIVDPDTFPMSYENFIATFCYSNANKLCMMPTNRQLFAEMISIRSLIISKKDCLDLPETVDVVRQIDLPEDIMREYNILYLECMTIIKGMDKSKLFYSTQSRLAVFMKLRQMASGFFMTEVEGNRKSKIIVDIHNAKIQELNAVLDQIPDEQVIIWCQFQHEIEMLYEELSKRAYTVTAYGKTKDLEGNIDDFKCGRAQYIIAHPKTLKYGVTFVNCKYTVYYSFSYSAEDYDQSHDRNYRLGQTETCTYIYIQAADTIDEVMYDKVMNKLSDAEFFEKLIKDAAKHGIDYDSLKEKNDYEIKEALTRDGGSLESLVTEIANRESAKRAQFDDGSVCRTYTTYDYLEKIDDPLPGELLWIEDNYLSDSPSLYLDYGIYSDKLFDDSRADYFDFIHAEEQYEPFRIDMPIDKYKLFLQMQSPEDWWVYDMYREVDQFLKCLPGYNEEVIREKYGLKTGRGKSNKTIASNLRAKYGENADGYIWNTANVANEIQMALSRIGSNQSFRRYVDEICKIFHGKE